MKTGMSVQPNSLYAKFLSVIPQDDYEIIDVLGQGGSGIVFKAREVADPRRIVAIKVVYLRNKEASHRIRREVTLHTKVSQMQHVLPLYRSFVSDDESVAGLVFQYIEGTSVEALGERSNNGLPDVVIASIALQACIGLAQIHEAGILHRDIKPSNLLISGNGRVCMADFGVAAFLSPSEGATITAEGNFVGTMRYAAPETVSGASVGPAADVYALGATVLFLTLGRQPFENATVPFLVRQILEGTFFRQLPDSRRTVWGELLAAMLNNAPERRPTASQVVTILRKRFPEVAGQERELIAKFLQSGGGIAPPPPKPPIVVDANPEPEDDPLRSLVQSLASQIGEIQAAVSDMTAKFNRRDIIPTPMASGASFDSNDQVSATFATVRKRLELNWRISLGMTVVLFSSFVAMLVLAVMFGILYQKSYWGIVFGGTSALSFLTVVVWRPMDKMLFATIASQQLELIQINYQRAITGDRNERREAFRDVSTQLNALLTKVTSKSRK